MKEGCATTLGDWKNSSDGNKGRVVFYCRDYTFVIHSKRNV